jgi:hypothetical protein
MFHPHWRLCGRSPSLRVHLMPHHEVVYRFEHQVCERFLIHEWQRKPD